MENYLQNFSMDLENANIISTEQYELIPSNNITFDLNNTSTNIDEYYSEKYLSEDKIIQLKDLLKKWNLNHLLPILKGNVYNLKLNNKI